MLLYWKSGSFVNLVNVCSYEWLFVAFSGLKLTACQDDKVCKYFNSFIYCYFCVFTCSAVNMYC